MIKDKIIELNNGINYYILDEISYNNKKYILAAECDLEQDKLKEENYIVAEIKVEGADLVTAHIEDKEVAQTVTKMLIEKVRNN